MPSYSVSLNAVVSPTGGSVARLDAVCAAGPTSNYVVVASAANLAVAGGRFRGVALEAASGNQAVQIVDFGTVDLLTTVLSGTGEFVSVNATGQLERTASVTSATIGTLENGTVHVNVALSLGSAVTSNATAIQGVPVSSASAALSYILAGDGTQLRSRLGDRNFQDWLDAYGVTGNGIDDCLPAFQAFLNAIPNYGRGIVPSPATKYRLCGQPYIRDDTAGGNKRGIHVLGEQWMNGYGVGYMFEIDMPTPGGSAGNILGNGNTMAGYPGANAAALSGLSVSGGTTSVTAFELGSGSTGTSAVLSTGTAPPTITISGTPTGNYSIAVQCTTAGARGVWLLRWSSDGGVTWAASGVTSAATVAMAGTGLTLNIANATASVNNRWCASTYAVLASNKSAWVGSWFQSSFKAGSTAGNTGEFQIVDVPHDGVVVYQGGSAGSDANDGAIPWRILRVGVDIRARDVQLEGLSFHNRLTQHLLAMLEINTAAGAGMVSLSNVHVHRCAFFTLNLTTSQLMHNVTIARTIVPGVGHANYSTNDAGVPLAWAPTQTDTINLGYNLYYGAQGAGIEHVSATAQSKECKSIGDRYVFCRDGYRAAGSGHMDVTDASFNCYDTCYRLAGSNSSLRCFTNGYSESTPRCIVNVEGTFSGGFHLKGGSYFMTHPSGEMIYSSGCGPNIVDCHLQPLSGSLTEPNRSHIVLAGGQANREQLFELRGLVKGLSAHVGRTARCQSTQGGFFAFTGAETIGVALHGGADAGTTRTYGFASNNFLYACNVAVDLNWVRLWHMAKVILGGTWGANRSYGANAVVRPGNGYRYLSGAAGVSHATTQPTWPTTVGLTVPDNTITWTCIEDLGAWGEADDSVLYIRTFVPRTGSAGKIQVPAGNNLTPVPFNADLRLGGVTTQLSKDTNNLLDHDPTNNGASVEPREARVTFDINYASADDATMYATNKLDGKRYGGRALGGNMLASITGMAGNTTAVPCKNFGGQVTISAAATVATVTFATAEDDANYRIGRLTVTPGAGFAAGSTRAYVTNKTTAGFDINLEVAPGGAVANLVDWGIER